MARTTLMGHDFMEDTGVAVSGGTVASSSMALTNVLTPQPSEFARFSNDTASNTYFVFHLARTVLFYGAANPPLQVFVGYTNVSDGGSLRIRAADSEADLTAAPTYDSGGLDFWQGYPSFDLARLFPRGVSHLHYSNNTNEAASGAEWWRVDINDSSNPDGYVQVGVISIGNPFQPGNPIANGWSFGAANRWVGQESMGGQRYRRSVSGTNTLEVTFQVTDEEEALTLHDHVRMRGESKPVLLSIDPESTTAPMYTTAWGFLSATQPIAVPHYGLWQTTLRVEEMP